MPKLKRVTGNYRKVLEEGPCHAPLPPDDFTANCSDIMEDILKDLNRNKFLSSNGRQFEDFITSWMSPYTSQSYTQGNMTARFYTLLIERYVLENGEQFQKMHPSIKEPVAFFGDRKNYDFAFYDDDGIPCGLDITYFKDYPNLWTVSIFRNTTAEPADRPVLILSPDDVISSRAGKSTTVNEAQKYIERYLNSKKVAKMVENLLLEDGTINIQAISALNEPRSVSDKIQNRKWGQDRVLLDEDNVTPVSGMTMLLEKLNRQYLKVKDWTFNEQELGIIRAKLKEKQCTNIKQAHEWYEKELLPLYRKRVKDFHQPELDKQLEQSGLRRNIVPALFSAAGIIGSAGLALTATGVLAPFGITLTGIAFLVGIIGAAAAAFLAVASALMVWQKEQTLADYKYNLSDLEASASALPNYQRKLQEINPQIDLSSLPKDKPVTLEQIQDITKDLDINPDTQDPTVFYRRAILGAKFSPSEFHDLAVKLNKSIENNPIQEEFAQKSDELLQAVASSLLPDEANRVISFITDPGAKKVNNDSPAKASEDEAIISLSI
jgi:hypothetical protein